MRIGLMFSVFLGFGSAFLVASGCDESSGSRSYPFCSEYQWAKGSDCDACNSGFQGSAQCCAANDGCRAVRCRASDGRDQMSCVPRQ